MVTRITILLTLFLSLTSNLQAQQAAQPGNHRHVLTISTGLQNHGKTTMAPQNLGPDLEREDEWKTHAYEFRLGYTYIKENGLTWKAEAGTQITRNKRQIEQNSETITSTMILRQRNELMYIRLGVGKTFQGRYLQFSMGPQLYAAWQTELETTTGTKTAYTNGDLLLNNQNSQIRPGQITTGIEAWIRLSYRITKGISLGLETQTGLYLTHTNGEAINQFHTTYWDPARTITREDKRNEKSTRITGPFLSAAPNLVLNIRL